MGEIPVSMVMEVGPSKFGPVLKVWQRIYCVVITKEHHLLRLNIKFVRYSALVP